MDPGRPASPAGSRPKAPRTGVAAVVLLVLTAGCLAGPGSPEGQPTETRELWEPPAPFTPVGEDASGLSLSNNGTSTEYTFAIHDLTFEDKVVTYALRANEDLQVGERLDVEVQVDRYPADGWVQFLAYAVDAPVMQLWGDAPQGRFNAGRDSPLTNAGPHGQVETIVSESRLQVTTRADGQTVVSQEHAQPEPVPFTQGVHFPGLSPDENLSAGSWVLVVAGGASPKLGDETVIEQRIAVTGSVDVYRLPDVDLTWGIGFDDGDEVGAAVTAGPVRTVRDATVTRETDRFSYLFLDTRRSGQGQGEILFPGDNRSIPQEEILRMSTAEPGRVGLEVGEWSGAPTWYMADMWLPLGPADR